MNSKKKAKIEKVSKPYLKGDVYDRTTIPGALKFFVGTVVMAIVYLLVCMMMNWDQQWLNIVVNAAVLVLTYLMFAQFGMNAGADAVNQGEIMYSRQEKGRPVADWKAVLSPPERPDDRPDRFHSDSGLLHHTGAGCTAADVRCGYAAFLGWQHRKTA